MIGLGHTDMRLQHGFSLVEALVSLLILKLGLLGVLAGQTLAIKQVQDALQRTQAVALSNTVVSELAANRALLPLLSEVTAFTEGSRPAACLPPASCSAEYINAIQLNRILLRLQHPSGGLHDAAVCVTPQGATIQLTMAWRRRLAQQPEQITGCRRGADRAGLLITANRG